MSDELENASSENPVIVIPGKMEGFAGMPLASFGIAMPIIGLRWKDGKLQYAPQLAGWSDDNGVSWHRKPRWTDVPEAGEDE